MNSLIYVTLVMMMGIVMISADTTITPSEQCPGDSFEGLRDRIQVIPCGKKRCKLQRNTNTTVIFKFKPSHAVQTLVSEVYATIGDLDLPFIGVTGVSACPQVKRADTGEPAPCPLQAGEEYVYTNVFPIENFYPTVGMRVHWSLKDGDKKVICFEVPAVITAASSKKN